MRPFRLQALGGFCLVRADGSEVSQLGRKEQALLIYLAMNAGKPQSRDKLASLLWSDRGEEQARHSLRQSLTMLRRALADADGNFLLATPDTLTLRADAIELDVERFARLASSDGEDPEAATGLYGGELFEGIAVRSEGFEEWLALERSRLHGIVTSAFMRLGERRAATGDHEGAILAAQRLLAIDPVDEAGHRVLMRAYAMTGRRAAAFKQFQACLEALTRQLGATPSLETVRLYEAIRDEAIPGTAPTRLSSPPIEILSPQSAEAAPAAAEAISTRTGGESLKPPWVSHSSSADRTVQPWHAFITVVVLMAVAVWYWFEEIDFVFYQPSSLARQIDTVFRQRADPGRMVHQLPDKPSIVILPFENLSNEPAQDIFVDAVTEGITVALATISDMFVIDRSSALTFKGRSVRVRQAAEELGVRYVLEGSIRRSTDRLRVSARLIDALNGDTLWADRFDVEATDIFRVQDDITLRLVTAVQITISEGEQERIAFAHGTRNLDAWLAASQGLRLLRRLTRADNAKAREAYIRAVALDPDYAGAWDGLGWTYFLDAWQGWIEPRDAAMRQAFAHAQRAIGLNDQRGRSHALLGAVTLTAGDHAAAIEHFERALRLSPGDAEVWALMAYALSYTGDLDRAEAAVRQAVRLSPRSPEWYRWTLGRIYRLRGRNQESIDELSLRLAEFPHSIAPRIELILAQIDLGRVSDARSTAQEVIRIDPRFSVSAWAMGQPYQDQSIVRRETQELRFAGLPE